MSYKSCTYSCNLSLKKVAKSKLTWIPVGIIVVLLSFTAFMNNRNQKDENLGVEIQTNLTNNRLSIAEMEEQLKKLDKQSAEYQLLVQNLKESKKVLKRDSEFLQDFQNENWTAVYAKEVSNLKDAIASLQSSTADEKTIQGFSQALLYYQALSKTNPTFEEMDYPVTSVAFLQSMTRYYLPVMIPLMIAFILCQLYGSYYVGKLNTKQILPESLRKVALKDILAGWVISLLATFTVVGVIFIGLTALFGLGNMDYPILQYRPSTDEMYFDAIGKTVIPSLLLFTLAICFIVLVTYLIILLTKNQLVGLFLSLLVCLAGILLPNIIEPLQRIAQFFPMLYIGSFLVTTGELQHSIENHHISVSMGIIVELVGISLIFAVILLLSRGRKNVVISSVENDGFV